MSRRVRAQACMPFLVQHGKDNLQNELVSKLYKEELLAEMMREQPEVAARRHEIIEMRTLLHKALEILNEVRDTPMSGPT
jgi:dynamin 1-like protein